MTDLAKMNELTCQIHGNDCPDICSNCRHGVRMHLRPDGCLQAGCGCRSFVNKTRSEAEKDMVNRYLDNSSKDHGADTIARLEAELESVTAERDRFKEALREIDQFTPVKEKHFSTELEIYMHIAANVKRIAREALKEANGKDTQ